MGITLGNTLGITWANISGNTLGNTLGTILGYKFKMETTFYLQCASGGKISGGKNIISSLGSQISL